MNDGILSSNIISSNNRILRDTGGQWEFDEDDEWESDEDEDDD